ncbi:hypothetical protein Q7P36_001317 [Cladosporium allicinum]
MERLEHNEAAYTERLPDVLDGHEHWIRLFELDPGPSCPTTSTTDGFNVSGRLLKCTLTDFGSHEDFLISVDLHYALRNLCHEHQPCYVWIDTICMNQEEITERNSQVKIMKEMYERAKSVCIWLGVPPSSAGDLTGARLQDINYDVVQHIASRGDRNWWRRRWVVQEAAAATIEPVILIGNLRLPCWSFIRRYFSFNMRLKRSDIEREIAEEISTFFTILNTRTSLRGDLHSLLRSTVDLRGSDPHYAIYAVVGLADDKAKQAVRVDYGMSTIDLYAYITQFLVEASRWGLEFPLNVVIGSCCQRLFLTEPSWILEFAHHSTHLASWVLFDEHSRLGKNFKVRPNIYASTEIMGSDDDLYDPHRTTPSQAGTTVCGDHIIDIPVNDNGLRALFDKYKDLRRMTCSGFVVGVISKIIPVHDHLLRLKTESQPAAVDESAMSQKLQCSEYRLATAFRRFEDLHARQCSVDMMAVFVTTDGDLGMCYSPMDNGRPGLDASSPVLKARDKVACIYGASSPVLEQSDVWLEFSIRHRRLVRNCLEKPKFDKTFVAVRNTKSTPAKLDMFLRPFHRREHHVRAQTPTPPTNIVRHGLGSAAPSVSEPVARRTSSGSFQTARSKRISLSDVLELLEPNQRETIIGYCQQNSSNAARSIDEALVAAKKEEEFCKNNKLEITIGTHTIRLRDKADTIIDLICKFKDLGTTVASLDPVHAGLPWAGVCSLLQIVTSQKEQKDALMNGMIMALSAQKTADLYADLHSTQSSGPSADELRRRLIKLYATILGFLAEALRLWKSGSSRFWNALLGDGELQMFPSHCDEGLKNVERAAAYCGRELNSKSAALVADLKLNSIDILGQVESLRREGTLVKTKLDLAKLPTAPNAEFDSYDQNALAVCLPNTRVDLLDDVGRWANDPTGTGILWLQGIAGEGKSTIAKTVAESLQDQAKLGASFFFKGDDSDRDNARKFFTTVAVQLAQKIGGLKDAIANILNDELMRYEKSTRNQFKELIADPLSRIGSAPQLCPSGLVVVVDALDECSNTDIPDVVELLAQIRQCGSFGIRVLVTSRPDAPVVKAFGGLERALYRQIVLQNHTRASVEHDIGLFLENKFEELRKSTSAPENDWPGKDKLQELITLSVPLFIFAATIYRFIAASDEYTPEEQLQAVFAESSGGLLTRTYLPILKRMVFDKTIKRAHSTIENFRNLVGPIVLSAEPLPRAMVIRLPGVKSYDQLKSRLGRLHSVLHVGIGDGERDQTIHPFHLSFRDFLINPEDTHEFQIKEQEAHASLAETCLVLMMETGKLHRDICKVSKPGMKRLKVDSRVIDSNIEPDLAYSCRHWSSHLEGSGAILDDHHQAFSFLTQHFLCWFEAMAWLGRASEVIHVIMRLKLLVAANDSANLMDFLEDARLFARENQYIVDLAPLQLYACGLVFAPNRSQVRSCFQSHMPQWVVLQPEVAQTWNDDLLELEGHTQHVTALSFSRDDKYLATASGDNTLRIWDAVTGNCVSAFLGLPPQDRFVYPVPAAVAFTSNSDQLAVANRWETKKSSQLLVAMHKFETGIITRKLDIIEFGRRRTGMLRGFDGRVEICLAFGPEKNTITVGTLHRGMLEVWRINLHSNIHQQIWCKDNAELAFNKTALGFAISSDASFLSCGLHGQGFTFWDLESGDPMSDFLLKEGRGKAIAFRGLDLLYIANDHVHEGVNLRSLDISTGHVTQVAQLPILYDDLPGVPAITSAGHKFAYAWSNFGRVRVRTLSHVSGKENTTHALPSLLDVKITPSGERLLYRFLDRLEMRDLRGHIVFKSTTVVLDQYSAHVTVSSDDNVIAAQMPDETLVWFVGSGKFLRLPQFELSGTPPAFSLDAKLLAIPSPGGIVVWDLELHQEVHSLKTPRFVGMLFSGDKRYLWAATQRFDLSTGECCYDYEDVPEMHRRRTQQVSLKDDWICWNSDPFMWLPGQYRPTETWSTLSIARGTISIRQKDNSMTVLKFTDPFCSSAPEALRVAEPEFD